MTKKPKVQSSQILYSGFYDLKQDLLQRPDGLTHPYTSILLQCQAVVVLAQDGEGRWILNREYRHPTGEHLLGCPGGRLEEGEDPIVGGQRELLEETGYFAEKLEIIGCCYPMPSLCDQKIHFLYAKNAIKQGDQKLDPFEFIETELKTDAELHAEIRSGAPVDVLLCAALWYRDNLLRK